MAAASPGSETQSPKQGRVTPERGAVVLTAKGYVRMHLPWGGRENGPSSGRAEAVYVMVVPTKLDGATARSDKPQPLASFQGRNAKLSCR